MSLNEASAKDRLNLFKLEDASQYLLWQRQLQEYLFKKIRNVNMDKLQDSTTLDSKFFEKHADFKEEFKMLKSSESTALDNKDFVHRCKGYAMDEGEGFQDWVYFVYSDIRSALSQEIQEKTAGVRLGDLTGLLKAIKLSVHHYELTNKHDLEIEYSSCRMSVEGKNDLMTFLSVLTRFLRRLEAAGINIDDEKKQRVLIKGLDQTIFQHFITDAKRQPYSDYNCLYKAVQEFADEAPVLEKLRALKPGNPQSALSTRTQHSDETHHEHKQPTHTQRLDRIEEKVEAIFVSLMKTNKPKRGKCFKFEKGICDRGDNCPYEHSTSNTNNNNHNKSKQKKYCALHKSTSHDTSECNTIKNNPSLAEMYSKQDHQSINTTSTCLEGTEPSDAYSFLFPTRTVILPQHIFTMRGAPKINLWCVDGAATTCATYDRSKCFNIRPCKVSIHGPNSKDSFFCEEMGDTIIQTVDKARGDLHQLKVTDVLISESFPFHIFSEILAFEKHCTAVKSRGSWQFLSPSKKPLFHASQQLLDKSNKLCSRTGIRSDIKLYFIDEHRTVGPQTSDTHGGAEINTTLHGSERAPIKKTDPIPRTSHTVKPPTKISTAKNLQLLLELHCAHDHWNFEDVAAHYGLTLPSPRPNCWACLLSKPKMIARDKVSTRRVTRLFEGFAADAKGPINAPTPEGFLYYFLIVCLYSSYYWVKLVKSQTEWKDIWQIHVKRCEARAGKDRCVTFIITDNHKVHSDGDTQAFNNDRGIETITCAPYSQWQDPAERGIQIISNGARTSLIHGGGKEWMWGWAVQHAVDSANRMPPPHRIPGQEDKSRLRIVFPAMTREKEMRTLKPFLCLCFKTVPKAQRGSNFNPRAEPCVHLRYVPEKKAYALLTIPNLYLTYSIEVRFVTQSFPLRVTDHLANQLDTFLRPTVEDTLYANVHGPGNILQSRRLANHPADSTTLISTTPTQVRQPLPSQSLPGPGWSSTRGYRPSLVGLESAAYVATIPVVTKQPDSLTTRSPSPHSQVFTPDQLAARTPKCIQHALKGPDAKYWLPAILKDFSVIRDNNCVINITDHPPPGPAPPAVEQRFKIKYRGDKPISLQDIDPGDWKVRTITRGDRFRHGEHYDATAAPVVHTPTLKMLVAWAVAKGLLLFQWDQSAAFYGNKMDRPGVIVRLPPGFDPQSNALRPLHLPALYGELNAALPGIPQGSLLHYKELSPAIQEQGFKPVDADNCLFIHHTIDMATSLHVDDGVLAAPSKEHAERVLGSAGLGGRKKITWGPLESTLGVDFKTVYTTDQRIVFMSQRAYAVTILERAGMLDCNPARVPAVPGRKYTQSDCPVNDEQKEKLAELGPVGESYHSIVASLNFLVSITRDDMRFIQGKLCKYCKNPGVEHALALKRALRYLKGTLDYGIEFSWRSSDPDPVDGPLDIVAWSDSSYSDDVDTGRSTIAKVIQVNGATVCASSKLSQRVDSCINHSELRAFAEVSAPTPAPTTDDNTLTDGNSTSLLDTSRTVAWLRGVKSALERRQVTELPPTPVLVDNAGVISMINDPTLKSSNRHIYRTLAENREHVHLDKLVIPVKINSKDNLANALTKQESGIEESAAQLRRITGPPSISI